MTTTKIKTDYPFSNRELVVDKSLPVTGAAYLEMTGGGVHLNPESARTLVEALGDILGNEAIEPRSKGRRVFDSLAVGDYFSMSRGGTTYFGLKVSDTEYKYDAKVFISKLEKRATRYFNLDSWVIEPYQYTPPKPHIADQIRALATGDQFTLVYECAKSEIKAVKIDDERYFSYTESRIVTIEGDTGLVGTVTKENA